MDLATGVYLSEAQNRTPYPPLHIVSDILIDTWKGGGRVEPERWLTSQRRDENSNMLTVSINK